MALIASFLLLVNINVAVSLLDGISTIAEANFKLSREIRAMANYDQTEVFVQIAVSSFSPFKSTSARKESHFP